MVLPLLSILFLLLLMIGAWTDFRSRTIPVWISLTALTIALWMAMVTQAYFLAFASLLIFIISNLSQWRWLPLVILISLLSSELYLFSFSTYFIFYALICFVWQAWLWGLVGGADVIIVQALLTTVPRIELLPITVFMLLLGCVMTWWKHEDTFPVVTWLGLAYVKYAFLHLL